MRWDWNVLAAGASFAWGLDALLEGRLPWMVFYAVLFGLNTYYALSVRS